MAIGELVDKITILEIKINQFDDENQIANANREYELLMQVAHNHGVPINESPLREMANELFEVNSIIWDTENELRELEGQEDLLYQFVAAARRAYLTNYRRYEIKRRINEMFNSEIVEEKQYG